jgi:hypothetical protein
MPAITKWVPEIFENSLDGVSSAVTPELIQRTQLSWGKNIINRGAKPGTRPSLRRLLTIPSGLVQGASYFGVQGGMGVTSIGGHIYRLRIGVNDATFEEILLPWWNSSVVKQVYMQQTVETLVIQDGQSDPILYDGSTAERSVPSTGGVPLGRQMAYGNGRLWVAINGKELVAGDIRTNVIGSELRFTETDYLSGGGTFFFPRGITGLNFIATTGTSDYGALLIFGSDYCDSLRADITFRDLWAQTPGFITSVLRHTGCASHWSLGQVNQDLYWRDAAGGIRSIRSSLADESGSGNAPISREVSRLTDYDSPQLLNFCSAISFNNRLLVTSSPRLNEVGGITWGDLISLDFAPVSTMRGKTQPAYDGQWQGINFTHLFQGQFNNRSRAFAISHDDDGSNSLWEIMPDGRGPIADETISGCTDGTGIADFSPITCTIEHGRRTWGNSVIRKRIERCDVYFWAMQGEVALKVYWRSDNNQKWQQWQEELTVCAKDGDPEDPAETAHVWKNLLPQQRPQIKTFTIPSAIDDITRYSLICGFEFQIRLVWTGRVKIYKTVVYATFLDDPPQALRELLTAQCLDNDVTGNEITYDVPVSPCPFLVITQQPEDAVIELPFNEGTEFDQYDGDFVFPELAFFGEGNYYSIEQVLGENRVFLDCLYHPMTQDHINGAMPVVQSDVYYPKGVARSEWSGTSTYDSGTDSYIGSISALVNESGFFPNPYLRPELPERSASAETFDTLFQDLMGGNYGPFFFASEKYTESGMQDGSFTRRWFSPPGGGVGNFINGVMGVIWVDGYELMVQYSGQITVAELGYQVARTGTAARTQHVTGYNPATHTYTGNKSRLRRNVDIPVGRSLLVADFKFLVTPDDLSAPYYLYITREYDVTPGSVYPVTMEFPWIVDATVYYDSGNFGFNRSYYQGFVAEALSNGIEQTVISSSPAWPKDILFACPTENADVWDDFDDFGGADTQASDFVTSLLTGYAWKGPWAFLTHSIIDCYDDFESYPDGEISVQLSGIGWVQGGTFVRNVIADAYDDFESYPDGAIVGWTFLGGSWAKDGEFIT